MDDGIIQLLFFVIVIIFSILDAIARKRKKEHDIEGMDRPREEDRPEHRHRQEPRGSLHRQEEEAPAWEAEAEYEGAADARDERGADTLIPGDLWEEITGSKRPSESPPAPPTPGQDSPERPSETRGPRPPAPGQRFPAPAPAPSPVPAPSPREESTTWDTRRSTTPRSSEARPDEFPDRIETTELGTLAEQIREQSRRELTEVETAPDLVEPVSTVPGRKRRVRSGAAVELTATLRADRTALQKAILYREVLGRPLGSRPGSGGWEEPVG